MSEMVERVARAIEAEWNRHYDAFWKALPHGFDPPKRLIDQELLLKQARAAIASMREPTAAMKIAAVKALGNINETIARETGKYEAGREAELANLIVVSSHQTDPVWRAMIDEALK